MTGSSRYRCPLASRILLKLLRTVYLSFIITTVMLPSLATATDSPKPPESRLNAYLLDASFPQHVIHKMDYDLKLSEFSVASRFVSFKEGQPQPNAGEADRSASVLSMPGYADWYLVTEVPDQEGYTRMKVSYVWQWDYAPSICLENKVSLAWTSGWFKVNQSSSWKYTAHSGSNKWSFSGDNVYSFSGLCIYHPYDILHTYRLQRVDSHSGWLSTMIGHVTEPDMAQLDLLGISYHQTLPFSGNFTATNDGSFLISPELAWPSSISQSRLGVRSVEGVVILMMWITLFVTVFSIPLFGIGLTALVRLLKDDSEKPQRDLNTVIFTWGLLVLAVLTLGLAHAMG